jgi:hypothetical protein
MALPLDFDIGVEDEAGDHRMAPGRRTVLEVGAYDAGEQPGADDVVGLTAQVHREDPAEQVGVGLPATGDLRCQRRRRPGVHHVGVCHEAARLAALRLVVAGRCQRGRVDRQLVLARGHRLVERRLTIAVDGVPDRKGHAEEPLS